VRRFALLVGLMLLLSISVQAQSYQQGTIVKWDTETYGTTKFHPLNAVVYYVQVADTVYVVTRKNKKPESDLASGQEIQCRIDKDQMFVVDAQGKEVKFSIVKKAPIPRTPAASGQEMFNTYCAVCHGKDAKGDGPAAAALKVPPPNLTMLSLRHGGKYPTAYVETVLKFGVETFPAHGAKDMPIWGPLLGAISVDAPEAELRIHNLNQYIESLQAK
jgi:cytochrome c553